MENTFGYKPLSFELITLFQSGPPDFAAAEELIRQGADVNDQGEDKSENVLSEILLGFGQTCAESEMTEVIRFFLAHGFDVTRNQGRHGAQCLDALHLSTFDSHIIEALKILLDAGAKNIPIDHDPEYRPIDGFIYEQSFQDACENNDYLGNIYEAAYQILLAVDEGRPYAGIDTFEAAIGKKILSVMADGSESEEAFPPVHRKRSRPKNCFYCNLYLLFDGGFLVCKKEAYHYVDTHFPRKPLWDVSHRFPQAIGQTIDDITFSYRDNANGTIHDGYGQPITTLHLSNGQKLNLMIYFGQENLDYSCGYWYFS